VAEHIQDILEQVKEPAAKRILFLPHAVNQMNAPERMISTREVRAVISHRVVIEDYPQRVHGRQLPDPGTRRWRSADPRCVRAEVGQLGIITDYLPSGDQWEADWRTRKGK